jgi:hypothetical protein
MTLGPIRKTARSFIKAAAVAMRSCAQSRRFYERKKARHMLVVAMKALTRDILCVEGWQTLRGNQCFG